MIEIQFDRSAYRFSNIAHAFLSALSIGANTREFIHSDDVVMLAFVSLLLDRE